MSINKMLLIEIYENPPYRLGGGTAASYVVVRKSLDSLKHNESIPCPVEQRKPPWGIQFVSAFTANKRDMGEYCDKMYKCIPEYLL